MPQSLSQLYVRLAFSTKRISPLRGYGFEGETATRTVGRGCETAVTEAVN